MQNIGEGTQKGGRREDKKPYAKPKGRCGGLGVSGEGGDPDPGKTLQIRWCMRVGGGWNGKQVGGENVYHMSMHLLAGGSDLLEGDCFSISPRQSSKTLAEKKIRICWVEAIESGWLVRTDVYIILRASLNPGSVILSCETLTFILGDLSEIPIRIHKLGH